MNVIQARALAARRGNRILGCLQHSITSRAGAGIAVLCSALFQQRLEPCALLGSTLTEGQQVIGECPKEGFEVVKALESKMDEEHMRSPCLFSSALWGH